MTIWQSHSTCGEHSYGIGCKKFQDIDWNTFIYYNNIYFPINDQSKFVFYHSTLLIFLNHSKNISHFFNQSRRVTCKIAIIRLSVLNLQTKILDVIKLASFNIYGEIALGKFQSV